MALSHLKCTETSIPGVATKYSDMNRLKTNLAQEHMNRMSCAVAAWKVCSKRFPGPRLQFACNMQVELMGAVNQILTPAAIEMLFGAAFLKRHSSRGVPQEASFKRHGQADVLTAFATFESGFELAASPVPHWLQPTWCTSRAWLLSAFR